MSKSTFEEIGALWLNVSRSTGKEYLRGTLTINGVEHDVFCHFVEQDATGKRPALSVHRRVVELSDAPDFAEDEQVENAPF